MVLGGTSDLGRQQDGALRLGQLPTGSSVFAQSVGRWLLEGGPVGLVAQLLEVAHERLQSLHVTAVRREDAPRARVQGASVLVARLPGRPFSRYRATLLAPRH